MPCMCGDIYCFSCGPAQGNYKCEVCGRWSDEGCEKPEECAKKSAEMDAAFAAFVDDYAAEIQWAKDHADEIAKALKEL